MPFTDTSRNFKLEGTTLIAECKTADGKSYKPSSISLDTLIGVVDGNLRWGQKGFSQTSRHIRLEGSQLAVEVKGADGKWTPLKIDLNTHIHNNKGVLEAVNINRSLTPKPLGHRGSSVDLKLTDSPTKSAGNGSNGANRAPALVSAASEASIASSAASSMFSSASSMSSSTSIESHTTTKKYIENSSFRSQSMEMSIKTTCTNLQLNGSILWADCLRIDGSSQRSSIDLDLYIGFANGAIVWGATGFSKSEFVRNIRIYGFNLVAECLVEGNRWVEVVLDLTEKLRNRNGVFIAIAMNADLSLMLSEVPWMKFRVIAEPDLSVFARHPIMTQTMTSIAESTVEHVTREMSSMITTAIQTAVTTVTKSAMQHIEERMEIMAQGVAGYGNVHGSATASGELRMMAAGGIELKGGAYAGGGVHAYNGGQWSGGGGAYFNGGSYSASETHLTGGAILTGSSGSFSSSSEAQGEYFASNAIKAGGKAVTPGRLNEIVDISSSS